MAPSVASDCTAASPVAPQTRAEQIRWLYQRFECHFQRGEYAACLPHLEQACQLTDSPRCLLNLGAVHHALMHCQLARSYYQQFLSHSPYEAEGEEARRALEELGQACRDEARSAAVLDGERPSLPPQPGVVPALSAVTRAAQAIAAEGADGARSEPRSAPPTLVDRSPPRSSSDRWLIGSLVGAGAAGAAATLIAAGYGMRTEREFERLDHQNGALDQSTDPRLQAIDRRGRHYNHLALGLGIASGALLAAGATLWIWDLGSDTSLTVSADGFAHVSYEGSL